MYYSNSVFTDTGNELEEEHLVDLSQWITSYEELFILGKFGLRLRDEKVSVILANNKMDIQSAVFDTLISWYKTQPTKHQAYVNLHAGLRECEMNMLASKLTRWVEGAAEQLSHENNTDENVSEKLQMGKLSTY